VKRRSSCLVAAALAVLAPASAQAAMEPVSVWILPFDVSGDAPGEEGSPDDLGVAFADLLTASLSRSPDHAVVDRGALAEVLAERSETGGVSRRLVWARWMLHGTVTRRGDSLDVTAHVTDVASTRILGSAQASCRGGPGSPELARIVEALTSELTKIPRGAGRRPAPDRTVDRTDGAPVANLHFMRGLSRYHAGQYHRALAEFLRSGADPEVEELSGLWRANCYLAAKRYDHAFLELSRLRRRGPGRVDPGDLQRLLEECLRHLSDEEVRAYRDL